MPNTRNNEKAVANAKYKKKTKYNPTHDEIWHTGYGNKKGIFQMKNGDKDVERLKEVEEAVKDGILPQATSKSDALKNYTHLRKIQRSEYIETTLANMPHNYMLVDNLEKLQFVVDKLCYESEIALDVESTGLGEDDYIVGISMSLPKSDLHCYIAFRHSFQDDKYFAQQVIAKLKPHFENHELKKILHNALGIDIRMLDDDGIALKGISMDTRIAMHVLNENEMSYALKNLATKYGKYFGFEDKSWAYEELFGKGGFQDTPLDIGTYYACKDTHLTYKLAQWIRTFFTKQPELAKAYELENEVISVVYRMQKKGMLLDEQFAQNYLKELKAEKDEMEKEFVELTKIENINSNKQLLEYLQKNVSKDIKSCDKKALKPLAKSRAEIDLLLKYRKIEKVYGTYISPIPEKVWKDGRVHPRFNQRGTVTCRFSSNDPNFQNLPYEAREMLVAPDGRILVGIDFS